MSDADVTRIEVELVLWRTRCRPEDPARAEDIAIEAGVPTQIARELLEHGLAEPLRAPQGEPRWPLSAAVDVARAVRLARDLGLNAQGAVLALQLLDRIDVLERRIARGAPDS